MKILLVLCAVLAVTVSLSERRKSPQTIKNCLEDLIKTTGQKQPGLKNWLANCRNDGFELLDKYFACQLKNAFAKLGCLQSLAKEAKSFKAKVDETIPKGYAKHMNELMANGKECIFA